MLWTKLLVTEIDWFKWSGKELLATEIDWFSFLPENLVIVFDQSISVINNFFSFIKEKVSRTVCYSICPNIGSLWLW